MADPTTLSPHGIVSLKEFVDGLLTAGEKGTADPKTEAPELDIPAWKATMRQSIEGFNEPPKRGQVWEFQKDGTFKAVPLAVAAMGQGGGLAAIERPLNFWPAIPVGSILVGGTVGMVTGSVIDALVPPKNGAATVNILNVALKGGAIMVLGTQGPRFMSNTATIISIGILGVQLLADVIPLQQFVNWVVAQIRRVFPAGQGAYVNQRITETAAPAGFLNGFPAGQTRNDLYASIFGGG